MDLHFSLLDQLKPCREASRDRNNLNRLASSLVRAPNPWSGRHEFNPRRDRTWQVEWKWKTGSSISWSTLELSTSKNTTLIDICSTPLRKPFLTRAFINLVKVGEGNTFQKHIFLSFYSYLFDDTHSCKIAGCPWWNVFQALYCVFLIAAYFLTV